MKVLLSGYFDVGFSIGIDDSPFNELKKASLIHLNDGMVFRESPKASKSQNSLYEVDNFGCNVMLGRGLCFDLTASAILSDWIAGARIVSQNPVFYQDFNISPKGVDGVTALFEQPLDYAAQCRLYASGIVIIEIEIGAIPENTDPEAAIRFLQTFEYAGYGLYGCAGRFQERLHQNFVSILEYFVMDTELKTITGRSRVDDANGQPDLFPGFTLLFFADIETCATAIKSERERWGERFTEILIDDNRVYGSWYVFVVKTRSAAGIAESEKNTRRLAYLIGIYSLFYAICDSHEKLLSAHVSRFIGGTGPKRLHNPRALINLRTISHVFITYTNYHTLTQNQEILALFRLLDNYGCLAQRHMNIRNTVEVLNSIQNQVEEEKERLREEKINRFIAIITSLTFISVIADFLNIELFTRDALPNIMIRGGIYLTVFFTVIMVLRKLFKNKD